MDGHTPGPWIVDDKTDKRSALTVRAPTIATTSAPCPAVCKVNTPRSWSEARANARLIAAAPALLAVVERLARNGECTCADLGGSGDVCDVCEARAALALARPKS